MRQLATFCRILNKLPCAKQNGKLLFSKKKDVKKQ